MGVPPNWPLAAMGSGFDPLAQSVLTDIMDCKFNRQFLKGQKIIRGQVGQNFFGGVLDPNVYMYVQVKFGDDSISENYVINISV